jgi:hypothetical protein
MERKEVERNTLYSETSLKGPKNNSERSLIRFYWRKEPKE